MLHGESSLHPTCSLQFQCHQPHLRKFDAGLLMARGHVSAATTVTAASELGPVHGTLIDSRGCLEPLGGLVMMRGRHLVA